MLRIKPARQARQWSQQQLAQRMGVAQNTVSNWENGRRQPTPQQLLRMAELLDVSVEYLLGALEADGPLSPEERQLLEMFRTLSPSQQRQLLRLARPDSRRA